jgi:CCR4-NOT transcription complex subunit 2
VDRGAKLYPTFVTPWLEPGQIPPHTRIEEPFTMPGCYNVHAPAVQSKLPNFSEDTLFYAFYTSPQDLLQIEVAEELLVAPLTLSSPSRLTNGCHRFNRGWRYHTELQIWLTSPSIPSAPLDGTQSWQRGPFVVFDPRTFSRQKTPDEFMVDSSLLEATRPAQVYVKELESEGLINGR